MRATRSLSRSRFRSARHRGEHPVAGAVAEVVVHRLEAVEVEHEQRAAHPVAAPVGHVALELLLEAAPVVEACERVVVGDVPQVLLRRRALGGLLARLGHVDAGPDHVGDRAVRAGQRGVRPLDQPQLAVARAPVELARTGDSPAISASRAATTWGAPRGGPGRAARPRRSNRRRCIRAAARRRGSSARGRRRVDHDDQRRGRVEHRIEQLPVPGDGDRVTRTGRHRSPVLPRLTRSHAHAPHFFRMDLALLDERLAAGEQPGFRARQVWEWAARGAARTRR